MSNFNVGDIVVYVEKCYDHHNNKFLKLDNDYEIVDVVHGTKQNILLKTGPVSWWVDERCISLSEKVGPYFRVTRKIKQMEAKRKSLGYKW